VGVGSGFMGKGTPGGTGQIAGLASGGSSTEPGASAAPGSSTEPGASASGDPVGTDPGASAPVDPVPAATGPVTQVAIVPVTNFRSARTAVKAAEISAIAAGTSVYSALVLVKADADGILGALGVKRTAFGTRLVIVRSATELAANLAANRTRLGFLRADEIGPSVRALAWGASSMFGVRRVGDLGTWPLTAQLPGPAEGAQTYDPATSWTMVAGGDILLDRGVSLAMTANGVDFPYNGGNVKITGRCRNCSPMGWDLPYTRRLGGAGTFTSLVKAADIAIANFENPAPNTWRLHTKGMIFSANPRNIAGVKAAGFDWVSMANNHIGDAGKLGIVQTQANLDLYGIRHTGAGKNCADAHKASLLKAGGVTVGILAYDSIAGYYRCGSTTAGSARLTAKALGKDIAAARARGADVVVVFPHWGIEYHASPSLFQVDMGHAAIDAGADLVIGNHPHWAEGMEVYKGKPIWYALGNLVFDQSWSEPTMEGITLELTFQGKDLRQVRIRPHLIIQKAQPNFMDPAGSGKVVMDQVWKASKGRLGW